MPFEIYRERDPAYYVHLDELGRGFHVMPDPFAGKWHLYMPYSWDDQKRADERKHEFFVKAQLPIDPKDHWDERCIPLAYDTLKALCVRLGTLASHPTHPKDVMEWANEFRGLGVETAVHYRYSKIGINSSDPFNWWLAVKLKTKAAVGKENECWQEILERFVPIVEHGSNLIGEALAAFPYEPPKPALQRLLEDG